MKPALLLVDLQNDYLCAARLQPKSGLVIEAASRLLDGTRRAGIPVIHIWTSVAREDDRRMPHWKRTDKWICVQGTDGHETPPALRPQPDEPIIHKTYFSGFHTGELQPLLVKLGCDTALIAGLYEHACIRTTAIDAYQSGLDVWIASDAVASDDPAHADITRTYLAARAAHYANVDELVKMVASN